MHFLLGDDVGQSIIDWDGGGVKLLMKASRLILPPPK